MAARSPLEAVELLDEAYNRGDIEAVLELYEDEAVMVVEPGRVVRGRPAIRAVYEWLFANLRATARQEKTHVIEAGELALFTSKWSFEGAAADGSPVSRESYASVVLRRDADAGWRVVVDNSWGPAVLG